MDNVMGDPSLWPLPSVGCATSTELYLKLAEESMKEAQKMTSPRGSASTQFNYELCKYLADKLSMTVQSARLFIELPNGTCLLPCSYEELKIIEVFKRFLAIAKEVEIFIQDCCKHAWVLAAVRLTNMSEHVTSLGFELELYRIIFSNSNWRLTSTEIYNVKRAEVEVVKDKASLDKETLLERVKAELGFLSGEERELSSFLLEKLNPVSKISGGSSRHIIPAKVFNSVQLERCERLGRGASATVHKARWFGTEVAKKTFYGPAETVFMKEASVLAEMAHPNIMSLFHAGQNRRSCYIITELMDGDLHNLMQLRMNSAEGLDSSPFTTMEQFDIMHQIASGMHYLHENNVVHRDLKSSNVLVKAFEPADYLHVKLDDFGLSKTRQLCKTFSNLNSRARWTAPEISCNLESQVHTSDSEMLNFPSKADVYSFGMVCYEVITGALPFSSISGQSVVKKVLNGDRPQLPDHLPNELRLLIEECWISEPSRRPSFAEIAEKLENLKYLCLTSTFLSRRIKPIPVPDAARSSQSSSFKRARTLQQQLGEGVSATCLPEKTTPIPVASVTRSSQCRPQLQQLGEGTLATCLSERTTPNTVPDEAGSSPCSSFESAFTLEQQPQQLGEGTSASCLSERTTPIKVLDEAGSSPCSSFARVLRCRPQLQQLGRGASATVYKAQRCGRWVAKKVFYGLDHPAFDNEVSVLKSLSHPNIMSLLDSGKEKDNCFILMELMDCDLLQLMEQLLERNCDSFPFTIVEAVGIMLQLAEGMKYLHENRIVHGDLKSPNILIKILENDCVDARVSDFGLATTNKKSTTYSDQEPNRGTDRWMAPELIKFPSMGGDQVNTQDCEKPLKYPYKIDVHSFAVICSEILTGERPFPTIGNSKEVKQKVLNGDRPTLPDHCPQRLKYLIERCWDEDPSKRPKFCEICEELKQILKHLQATGIVQDIQIVKVASSCARKGMETGHARYASTSLAHTWPLFSKVRGNLFIQVSLLIVGVFLGTFLGVFATLVGMGLVPYGHSRGDILYLI